MNKRKSPLISLSRLEAITDGIFAIVITIMILNIRIPLKQAPVSFVDFSNLLRSILPQILSYAVAFFLIASFWLTHIHSIKMCVCTNKTHIILNFGYIFTVSFIPLTTSLVGLYPSSRVTVILFHCSVLVVYTMALVLWLFVSKTENLLSSKVKKIEIQIENWIYCFRILTTLTAIFIAIYSPLYSYGSYVFMQIIIYFLRRQVPEASSTCSIRSYL